MILVDEIPGEETEFTSGGWVWRLAQSLLGHPPEALLTRDNLGSWLVEHPQVHDVVILDDASYSGTQAAYAASEVWLVVSELFAKLPADYRVAVHLGIPFMTSRAQTRITYFATGAGRSKEKISLQMAAHQHIYTVDELIQTRLPEAARPLVRDLLEDISGDLDERALTYFQHKLPDAMSVFLPVFRGTIHVPHEGRLIEVASVPFIPKIVPPYKPEFAQTGTSQVPQFFPNNGPLRDEIWRYDGQEVRVRRFATADDIVVVATLDPKEIERKIAMDQFLQAMAAKRAVRIFNSRGEPVASSAIDSLESWVSRHAPPQLYELVSGLLFRQGIVQPGPALPPAQSQPIIPTRLEPIGDIILGGIDPRQLSATEFDQASGRLFHGAAKPFTYEPQFDYSSDEYTKEADGSQTIGVGFYATNDYEAAVNYSLVRGAKTPVALTVLPYQARMLDLRAKSDLTKNAFVPRELFDKWRQYFTDYYKKTINQEKPWYIKNFGGDYLGYLSHVAQLPTIDLRVMLWTGSDPRIREGDYPGPPWVGLFSDFMRGQGYDGLIYVEGGEGINRKSSASYIFYNLGRIGTYESWQQNKSAPVRPAPQVEKPLPTNRVPLEVPAVPIRLDQQLLQYLYRLSNLSIYPFFLTFITGDTRFIAASADRISATLQRVQPLVSRIVPPQLYELVSGLLFRQGIVQPGPALPAVPAPGAAKQVEPTAMTRRDFLKLSAVGAVGLAGAYVEFEKGLLGDIARLVGDRLEEFFNPISDIDNAAGTKNIHGVPVYGLNTPLHTPNDVEDLYTRLNHTFFDLGKQDLEAWIQRTRLEAQLTGNVISLPVRDILLKPNERYLEVVTRKSAYESFLRRKGETGVDFVQWVQMHVDTTNRMLEQAKPQSSKRAVLRRILIVDDSVTQDWSDRYEKEWKDTGKLGSALDVWYRNRFGSPMDTDTTWAIADDYRGKAGAYFWDVQQNTDGTVTFSKPEEGQKTIKTFTFPFKDDSLRAAHNVALDLGLIHEWSHFLLGLPDEYLLNVNGEGLFRFKGFYLDTGYFEQPHVSPYLSYLLKNPAKTTRVWDPLNQHFNEIPKTITLRVSENDKPLEGKLSVYEATYPKGYYQSKRFSRSPTVEGEGPSLLLPPKLFGLMRSGEITYYPTNWLLRVHSENGEKELHLPVAAFNMSKIAGKDAVTYDIVFTGYEDAKKPFQALQMIDAAEFESYLENHRDNDPVYAYAKIDGTSTYFVWLLRDVVPVVLPEGTRFLLGPTFDSNGNFRLEITDVPSDDPNYFLTVLQPLGQGRTITVMNTSGVPVEVGRVYRQVTYESNLKGKVTISPGQTTIRVDPDETVFVKESIQNDKPQKPLKIRLYNFSRSTEIKNIAWVMRGEDIYSLSTTSMGVPLESLFQSIENHLISNFPGQTVVIVNDYSPSPVEAFKINVTLFGADIKPGETQTVTIPQTETHQELRSLYPDSISVELSGGGVYTFDSTKNLEEWINDGIKGYWLKRGETLKMGNDLDREIEIFGIKIPSGETQIITIPKWTNMLEEAAQSFLDDQLKDCGLGALRIFPQVYADEVGRGTGICAWWAKGLQLLDDRTGTKLLPFTRAHAWKMPWRVILGGAAIDLTR